MRIDTNLREYYTNNTKNAGIVIIFILFYFYIFTLSAQAVDPLESTTEVEEPAIYTLRLDEATVLKGYTFVSPDKDFKVGVVDGAATEPMTVRFKQIPDSHMLTPLEKAPGEQASKIWEFDLLADDGSIGELIKPIYAAV